MLSDLLNPGSVTIFCLAIVLGLSAFLTVGIADALMLGLTRTKFAFITLETMVHLPRPTGCAGTSAGRHIHSANHSGSGRSSGRSEKRALGR